MANESDTNTTTLKTYVNDMLALEKHIFEVVERQYEDARVKDDALTFDLIGKIKSTVGHHITDLEAQVTRLGSETMAAAKAAVAGTLGAAAGLYDKIRKDPVSRMLRDNYTALNMASFSYTMLHTTGLAYSDAAVADLAVKHLQDLTPLNIHCNESIPHVVVEELQDEGPGIDTSVAAKAIANTQHAWKPS